MSKPQHNLAALKIIQIMNYTGIYQKYSKLVPKIKKSQKSLRNLAKELHISVNTLRNIKEAIQAVESQSKTVRKTIRFTPYELQRIEEKAKDMNMDISNFVRFCISQVLS